MTQKRFFLTALICLMMSVSSFATDKVITANQLPEAAQTFVKEMFPNAAIIYVEIDDGKYEVYLNNGTEIKFDLKGNWNKVNCELNAVPARLVPASIADCVEGQFPEAVITKIDKEHYGYDLKFDRKYMTFGIDN